MTHLDSSFLIDLLRENVTGAPGAASFFLRKLENEDIAISIFVECELYAGVELSRNPAREKQKVERLLDALVVDAPGKEFPQIYSRTLAKMEKAGQRVSTMDLLIAVTALSANAVLVTRNAKDFSRVPGLQVLTYT